VSNRRGPAERTPGADAQHLFEVVTGEAGCGVGQPALERSEHRFSHAVAPEVGIDDGAPLLAVAARAREARR